MTSITQKLENTIYGYDPNQYVPIFYDGKLSNRGEFVAYKAKRVAGKFGSVSFKALQVLDRMVEAAN